MKNAGIKLGSRNNPLTLDVLKPSLKMDQAVRRYFKSTTCALSLKKSYFSSHDVYFIGLFNIF